MQRNKNELPTEVAEIAYKGMRECMFEQIMLRCEGRFELRGGR